MGPMFDFGEAVKRIKTVKKVAREGWNGKGMWLQYVDQSDERLAYIEMRTVQGMFIPWLASQTDILADDWFEVH